MRVVPRPVVAVPGLGADGRPPGSTPATSGNGKVTLSYTVGDTSCVPVPVQPPVEAAPALVTQPHFTG